MKQEALRLTAQDWETLRDLDRDDVDWYDCRDGWMTPFWLSDTNSARKYSALQKHVRLGFAEKRRRNLGLLRRRSYLYRITDDGRDAYQEARDLGLWGNE